MRTLKAARFAVRGSMQAQDLAAGECGRERRKAAAGTGQVHLGIAWRGDAGKADRLFLSRVQELFNHSAVSAPVSGGVGVVPLLQPPPPG